MTKGKRIKKFVISIVITVVIGLIMDYLWPTPWNLHSMSTWFKTIILLFLFSGINALNFTVGMTKYDMKYVEKEVSFPFFIPIALGIIMVIGGLTGAEIFNSKRYASIISVEKVDSTSLILSEEDAESIALMDTASAKQLGDREIGAIENFSAFNVSNDYVQLNVNGDAVKVAPLEYAGFFKWMKNKDKGVAGYVSVSPTTMTADYVELEEGMQYVRSAYFSKDLNRHIHYQYPTLMYGNTHFEIDEDGKPFYVSSVYSKTIGLFGGEVVTGCIVTDPVSGESQYYDLADTPQWVDNVVHGDLICSLYNVAYKNVNGFWNGTSFGANTGCMQTTTVNYVSAAEESDEEEEDEIEAGTDFGYIAKDGDIYIYTGVTSMAADSSNLGFIMVNERTGEYKYFPVSGANEQSAMNAAEGEVQQYSYQASFPTLINVDDELTYIGVLKDNSGLVKMYYMVNVKDYGKVAVATTREECVQNYAKRVGLSLNDALLDGMDIEEETIEEDEITEEPVTFTISVIQYVDIDGNTYVYLGTSEQKVYKALFADNEELLFAEVGDTVKGTVSKEILSIEEISNEKISNEEILNEETDENL